MADPQMKIATVTDCHDCPFFYAPEDGCDRCAPRECWHPIHAKREPPRWAIKPADLKPPRRRPKWCPLERHPALVQLGGSNG